MEGGLGETQRGRIGSEVGEEGAEDCHIAVWGGFEILGGELGDIILSLGGAEGVRVGGVKEVDNCM